MNTWLSMLPQPAVAEDPLERLDMLQRAVNDLRRGEALPAPIAAWLVRGFGQFIDRGGNLGECLGFQVRRGGRYRAVTALAKLARRDQYLCIMASECAGGSLAKRARAVADYLHDRGPEPLPGFSSAVRRMIEQLEVPIPDERQLRRILATVTLFGVQHNPRGRIRP